MYLPMKLPIIKEINQCLMSSTPCAGRGRAPRHKQAIVRLLKEMGEVTAMTGAPHPTSDCCKAAVVSYSGFQARQQVFA